MLLTLSETKLWLGLTGNSSDAILNMIIPMAESYIASLLNIQLEQATITNEVLKFQFSMFDASGATGLATYETKGRIRLKKTPVISITNVSHNNTVINDTNYLIDLLTGIITFKTYYNDNDNKLTCTYIAGYTSTSLPLDLKMLILDAIKSAYQNSGKTSQNIGNIQSKRIGDYSVTFGKSNNEYLNNHKFTINKYTRIAIA